MKNTIINQSSQIEGAQIVLIDNLDSFSYNLVDELRTLGAELTIYRNTVSAQEVLRVLEEKSASNKVLLVISPGPGAPSQAGCVPELLKKVRGRFAVLGICLGHQAIVESYNGKVGRAPHVMHGKSSLMHYSDHKANQIIFKGLSQPLSIARYHSLAATQMPDSLQVIADIDGLPMAVLHADDNMLGFQFHPESILTCDGSRLLKQSAEYLLNSSVLNAEKEHS
jgi:anthranilate synthase component 2